MKFFKRQALISCFVLLSSVVVSQAKAGLTGKRTYICFLQHEDYPNFRR